MTIQSETNNVAKETIEILKYFDSKFLSKISENFLKELRQLAKDSNLEVKIDKNKKLKEQEISDETKSLISIMYYRYFATEEEKKDIIKIWNSNEKLYQKTIKEEYNQENLFKKKNKVNVNDKDISTRKN